MIYFQLSEASATDKQYVVVLKKTGRGMRWRIVPESGH